MWADAQAESGWEVTGMEAPGLPMIVSSGWCMRATREMYILASDLGGRDNNRRIRIPRGMVKSVTEVTFVSRGRELDVTTLMEARHGEEVPERTQSRESGVRKGRKGAPRRRGK